MTVFVGMLLGSTAYTEVHSTWSEFADATRLSSAPILPRSPQLSPVVLLPVVVLMAGVIYRWYQHSSLMCAGYAGGYLQPLHAAILLALIGFISYLVIRMPLGITTSYTRLVSSIGALIIPEYIYKLSHPGVIRLSGVAGPVLDGIAALQYPLIAGIVPGALLYSLKKREFAWRYRVPFRQSLSVAAGGVLLGWRHVWRPGAISGICGEVYRFRPIRVCCL